MGRFSSVTFDNQAFSTATDIFEIQPADDKPCRIAGLFISNFSDVGDSAEELLRLAITRVTSTFTTGGGTTFTPIMLVASDTAAGYTAKYNNGSTVATGGAYANIFVYPFNIRTGIELFLPPEMWPTFVQGTGGVVRLLGAPADAVSLSGTLFVEELG